VDHALMRASADVAGRYAGGCSPLPELIRAVEEGASIRIVRKLIDACVVAGALRDESGTLVPLEGGPYRIKRESLTPRQLAMLDVIVRRIRGLGLHVVPTWVAGARVLTLHRQGAIDLRAVASISERQALWVRDRCLESFTEFSRCDDELRAALAEAGFHRVPAFPIAERHAAGVAKLSRLLAMQTIVPQPVSGGRSTLFCDPKPANFIVTSLEDEHPERIDLDLMCFLCPVSLQVVLAFFSHPVRLPGMGSVGERFAAARVEADARARELGALPGETDSMLVYHLIRNFTSAYEAQGGGAKAHALAPLLACALEQIPASPAREAARRLRRLSDIKGEEQ
jgi:hypothetical protein